MPKQLRPYSVIVDQIATIKRAGMIPSAIVVDRARYTQLLEDMAQRAGLDYLDAVSQFDGAPIAIVSAPDICEVVADAQQQWMVGDEIDSIIHPDAANASEPRFVEI